MAGLAAAARATELGARALVLEKASEPGGSMRLSSGVVWRYRDLATFREQCPGGDPAHHRLVVERLDEALAWLEELGAPILARETGNPLTKGIRFDVDGLTATLAARGGELRLGEPLADLPDGVPVVLATGGFQASPELVEEHIRPAAPLALRASPQNTGDGLRLGLAAGAATTGGMDEFYGRNMPAPPARVRPQDFVPLAQLYARHATVEALDGERYPPEQVSWHETDVVQWVARKPRAEARYLVESSRLDERVGARTVGEMVAAARRAGARVEERPGGVLAVPVAASITTTLGGLRVDECARVLATDGRPVPGLFAAGADAGGVSTGGYSSGLAAALVLGRLAAEHALGDSR